MNFNIIEPYFVNLLFILFLINPFAYWSSLIFSTKKTFLNFSNLNSIISLIALFLYLTARWFNGHYFPISNLYESILFLSWVLTFLVVFGELKTKSRIFGSILTPITLLLISFATLTLPVSMQKISPLVPALQSNWLMMHVSMMMASYAVLLVGSVFSILYLVINENSQDKNLENLKKKKKIYLTDNLDLWSYKLISFGFPILTIGIISGAVWANEAWGSYWSWDPKETWALITWLTFSSYLHARLIQKADKKQSSLIASLGFLIVWICYLGVNFLGQGLHSYGWISS